MDKSIINKSESVSLTTAVDAIKTAILQGQYEAAKDVNRIQLALYFAVGRYLSKHTRHGVWGTGAISAISGQLRRELPGLRGFSENNLKNMRKFYEAWTMLDASTPEVINDQSHAEKRNSTIATVDCDNANSTIAIVELQNIDNVIDVAHSMHIPNIVDFPIEEFFNVPFTHHVRIVESRLHPDDRYYYIRRVAQEKLSVDKLKQLIAEEAHKHDKGSITSNFSQALSSAADARKAVMMFKDEYLLNFINVEEIGVRDNIDVDERVIEQEIVKNIKDFIMTFGNDFAFIGNQYHLEVYGVEQFPDLLFFNRELNAMVVVELKSGEFKTSYLGQLAAYLRILDDKVRKPHENPSIGIVLCKSANREFVEYIIQDYSKPMGVATYKTADEMPENLRRALPDIEQLKKLL